MARNLFRLPRIPSLTWDDCRLLVDSVVDYAIFMLDADGYVATWNGGAQKIKGYEASEIVGQHFTAFYPPEDVAAGKPERLLRFAAETGRVEDEGFRVRKDGSQFWANVVITALRDEAGRLRGFGKVTRDLTAEKTAAEELRRSEERFRLLVENIGDYAIFMLDAEGCVSTWNLGAERLKGYSAREISGRHFSLFFPPEDIAAGKPDRELEAARKHGRFEDEGFRLRKDGSRFWANATLTAVHDQRGTLLGFAKITRDLTARRETEETERRLIRERAARAAAEEAERKLRQSEEQYRALSRRLEIVLEGVADGITVQGRDGKLVFANTAAARLCGFETADELLSATPQSIFERFEMLDEDGRPFAPERLPGRLVLAGQPSASALLDVHERKTGKHWWSAIRSTAVLGSDGAPDLAVNIWHDVTIEHRAERDARFIAEASAALISSVQPQQLLRAFGHALVPSLADWCSIYLLEGSSLRNVASVHADPSRAALGEEYHERFSPAPDEGSAWSVVRSGRAELHNEISDEIAAIAPEDPEHARALRALGVKSAVLGPILLRSRVLGVICLASAETERRYDESHLELLTELGERVGVALERAELYRAANAAAAAASEANRAKDEFLATVSHELRTPLSAILGWAAIIKDRVTEPALIKPIESIYRNAQAQVRIIDDILDVSRVITGKFHVEPKPVDLLDIARQAADVVRPSASAKSIELTLDFEADFCFMVVDPARMQQVIWNLLSNAIKFTPSGGTVSLSVRQVDTQVMLRVADTGMGIDPEFLPYVFDRFRQADASATRQAGGLGLGLALVKHIVELHGGSAEAASGGRGTGATFSILLPVNPVEIAPGERRTPPLQRPPRPTAASLSGFRVLIVDDEADAREVTAAMLEEAGAEVVTAGSVAEGLSRLERFQPDVVLCDVAMPGEDGFVFVGKLRQALPPNPVPVVALTAFARDEDRKRALQAGFSAHVSKPAEADLLTSTVARLARRDEP